MALKGREGQRFSQAPQPMQRSSLTTGISGESSFDGSILTICMAPTGQWRAQLPQGMPSEGDAPRVGDDEPVQRLQQRTPTLARDTVDGSRREVHRHTVEERPLPVANPEGVNRNHKGSG